MVHGVALVTAAYLNEDRQPNSPSIRLAVNCLLETKDVSLAVQCIEEAVMSLSI
jgi:hypothetical protein